MCPILCRCQRLLRQVRLILLKIQVSHADHSALSPGQQEHPAGRMRSAIEWADPGSNLSRYASALHQQYTSQQALVLRLRPR